MAESTSRSGAASGGRSRPSGRRSAARRRRARAPSRASPGRRTSSPSSSSPVSRRQTRTRSRWSAVGRQQVETHAVGAEAAPGLAEREVHGEIDRVERRARQPGRDRGHDALQLEAPARGLLGPLALGDVVPHAEVLRLRGLTRQRHRARLDPVILAVRRPQTVLAVVHGVLRDGRLPGVDDALAVVRMDRVRPPVTAHLLVGLPGEGRPALHGPVDDAAGARRPHELVGRLDERAQTELALRALILGPAPLGDVAPDAQHSADGPAVGEQRFEAPLDDALALGGGHRHLELGAERRPEQVLEQARVPRR